MGIYRPALLDCSGLSNSKMPVLALKPVLFVYLTLDLAQGHTTKPGHPPKPTAHLQCRSNKKESNLFSNLIYWPAVNSNFTFVVDVAVHGFHLSNLLRRGLLGCSSNPKATTVGCVPSSSLDPKQTNMHVKCIVNAAFSGKTSF